MKGFEVPNTVTVLIQDIPVEWLRKNPLLFRIKTFAKNEITERQMWGGFDYIISPIIINQSKTVVSNQFFSDHLYISRDLSAMELRPVEYHYSLVEIELMNEKEIEGWMKYVKESKNFFAYEKILGNTTHLMNILKTSGNSKVSYRSEFNRIRDLWESKEDDKVYEIKVELK